MSPPSSTAKQRPGKCTYAPHSTVKLVEPPTASQVVGESSLRKGSILQRAIGNCLQVNVKFGLMGANCLVDAGAEVSTVTHQFFWGNLAKGDKLVDVSAFIQISASQGSNIPYVGYVELSVTALDHTFHNLGFLVVKDPTNTPVEARKLEVPVVLGSNVMRDIRQSLEAMYGNEY